MNENFKELNKDNALSYLREKEYGTENVIYSTEEDRLYIHKVMDIVNMIAGIEAFRETPFMEEEYSDIENMWVEVPSEGKYRITYTDRHNPVPEFTEDDINVFNSIPKALELKESYYFEIHQNLKKHVRKACKDVGVSFKANYPGVTISGKERSESVYKQMFAAYNSGVDSISFDSRNINVQTIRVYASQLGAAMGDSFSCSIVDGKITVHFKGISAENQMRGDIKKIIEKYSKEISDSTIQVIMDEFSTKENPVSNEKEFYVNTPTVTEAEPLWAQMGFNSEREYIEYEERKKADVEAWEQPTQGADDLPEGVEIVEGLPQYVITGFEAAIAETAATEEKLPEDDDF